MLLWSLVICPWSFSLAAGPTNNPTAATLSVTTDTNGALLAPGNFFSQNVSLLRSAGIGGADTNALHATNNLSDLTNAAAARANLGLGSAATNAATAFQPASSQLTALATSNGAALTNINATNLNGAVQMSNGGLGVSFGSNYVAAGAIYTTTTYSLPTYQLNNLKSNATYMIDGSADSNYGGVISLDGGWGSPVGERGVFNVPTNGNYALVTFASDGAPVLVRIYEVNTNAVTIPDDSLQTGDIYANSLTLTTALAWSQIASPAGPFQAYSTLSVGPGPYSGHAFVVSNGVDGVLTLQNKSGFNQPTGGHYSAFVCADAHGNQMCAIGYGETNATIYRGIGFFELEAIPATPGFVPYFFGQNGHFFWGCDPGSYYFGTNGTLGRFVVMKANCTNFDNTNVVLSMDSSGDLKTAGNIIVTNSISVGNATNLTPSVTGTVNRWMTITNNGTRYFVPLYL